VSGGLTSMDDFLKEFFQKMYLRKNMHLNDTDYYKYDDQVLTFLTLLTSSLYISTLLMTFFASSLTRTKRRKANIIVGAHIFFLIFPCFFPTNLKLWKYTSLFLDGVFKQIILLDLLKYCSMLKYS